MAVPVISSATFDKTSVKPGESATLTVVASDPDSRTVTIDIKATDSAGAAVTGAAVLTVGDPVVVTATTTAPGVTITPAGGFGKFVVVVAP